MPQYAKLEPRVRKEVEAAFAKLSEHAHAGLHLEKIRTSRDPRVRTIRIDKYWRGVVLAPETGDTYCLMAVLGHDEAINYAASHRFTVNKAIGVIEVRNEKAIEQLEPVLGEVSQNTKTRLFAHVRDKDLIRLGIDAKVLPVVRLLTDDTHLQAMEPMLPGPQYIALLALAQHMTVEEAWAEVAACSTTDAPPAEVDEEDLVMAMRRTPGEIAFVDGPGELREMLAHPFDTWRVFLHPLQRKVALRASYSGPAQVTGGAGTGKTVTALHRARHLAERDPDTHVLLTTFTRNLAKALEGQLDMLIDDPGVRGRIDVMNIDRVAFGIVATHRKPVVATPDVTDPLWAVAANGTGHTATFLATEWEQVVLAQGLTREVDYLSCSRSGRGVPLPRNRRSAVWHAISGVVEELRRLDRSTFHQLADEAAHWVAVSADRPYDHVIIDEAQDLHPAQWRLLRALVPAGRADDLFIVGDPHQRIYDNHVSLASLGIDVRGRSTKLKINYRTTQETLSWAVPLLGLMPVTGLDDATDTLSGYRSPMHGRRPSVRSYATWDAELAGLVEQVRGWLDDGVEPNSIGVAARWRSLAKTAAEALKAAGIKAVQVPAASSGVRVATMHKMKGLEFRCVAAIGVNDETVPSPSAITPEEEDKLAHQHDLQRERCLLFVACTRARDRLYVSYSGRPSPFLPAK